MLKKTLNIGILGCANIAKRSIIPAIKLLPEKFNLLAIASRNYQKAKELAVNFDCEAIEGYENILKREDLDAIYIPLPTGIHAYWIDRAIEYGKHVYCEKSFTHNYKTTENLIEKARKKNLVLMEGFMFIYHSQQKKIKKFINQGLIGEVRSFSGHFGFPPLDKENFRYSKELGGGSLLDAGAYPLRAARYFINEKLKVENANLFFDKNKGVDIWGSAYLKTSTSQAAFLSFGFNNSYKCSYEIWGSKGHLSTEKAYTPNSKMKTKIIFEDKNGKQFIEVDPDDHFKNILIEFFQSISNKQYEKHYADIAEQGYLIDQIFTKANLNYLG